MKRVYPRKFEEDKRRKKIWQRLEKARRSCDRSKFEQKQRFERLMAQKLAKFPPVRPRLIIEPWWVARITYVEAQQSPTASPVANESRIPQVVSTSILVPWHATVEDNTVKTRRTDYQTHSSRVIPDRTSIW